MKHKKPKARGIVKEHSWKTGIVERKRFLSEEAKQLEAWRLSNSENFNTSDLLAQWKLQARQLEQPILDLAIQSFAFCDAVNRTNEALNFGLGMKEAGVDLDLSIKLLESIFRVELASIYLKNNRNLTPDQASTILDRVVAQQFPTKDNVPMPTRTIQVPLEVYRGKGTSSLYSTCRSSQTAPSTG